MNKEDIIDCVTQVEKVLLVEDHPHADKLEFVKIRGYKCIVRIGDYKKGDLCVFIPPDSILPSALEKLLVATSKVKLYKSRVRAIRIRGLASKGLITDIDTIKRYLGDHGKHMELKAGLDITEALGITKHEPGVPDYQQNLIAPLKGNSNFKKYTKMPRLENHEALFEPDDRVVVTEKVHGTNFRAGWVPSQATTAWQKVKNFFGYLEPWDFVFGSHNIQLQNKLNDKGDYEKNVYSECVKDYKLKEKIDRGTVIYGEIYGAGIQKHYDYGLKYSKGLVVFDVMDYPIGNYSGNTEPEYWDFENVVDHCQDEHLPHVPVLFEGAFKDLDIEELFKNGSILCPEQKTIEGVVITSLEEADCYLGRKKVKCINPAYLEKKDNTDFH